MVKPSFVTFAARGFSLVAASRGLLSSTTLVLSLEKASRIGFSLGGFLVAEHRAFLCAWASIAVAHKA